MTAINVRGDARHLPLPDASVDLICTSPPYFALRSYQDGGEHYDGQIGSETTPTAFVDALIECTREMMRVLKPSGSIFVNLGDKYNSAASGQNGTASTRLTGGRHDRMGGRGVATAVMPTKSLMGLPWRYALRCIDDLGFILRAEIIWDKPNGLPESVNDRVRRSHEQWFHFVKQPRYYSAVDEVREPHVRPLTADQMRSNAQSSKNAMRHGGAAGVMRGSAMPRDGGDFTGSNPLGKLPGSVWTIPSQPLKVPEHLGVDHFAAFPTEWPRRIILGWTPPGICVECGEGRRPTAFREYETIHRQKINNRTKAVLEGGAWQPEATPYGVARMHTTITGYTCDCPQPTAPTRPAVVCDPFGGTGTTALVAHALGRHGISIDLSHDYTRLAQWRTHDPAELAKALHVDKPPTQLEGQLDLLGDLT